MPNKILTLAKPVSASNKQTLLPRVASAMARLTEVVVLPTPPFPLVIAMTRAEFVNSSVLMIFYLNYFNITIS